MPYASPRPCRKGGCPELVTGRDGFCEVHRKAEHKRYNAERPESHRLYHTPQWRRLRSSYLEDHMLCERGCGRFAVIVHHKTPHDGDFGIFMDYANLEALCRPCHNREHNLKDTA